MLGTNGTFHFPKLKFFKTGSIIKSTSPTEAEGRTVNLYKIDWLDFEKKKEERYNIWRETYYKDKNLLWYTKSLPDPYFSQLSDAVFCLDHLYLSEIQRCCRHAKSERERKWGFDTSVRDRCFEISETYIDVAFYLLCDCLFSVDNNYWHRDFNFRKITLSCALYSFWKGQTGRGLLWQRARLNELQILNNKDGIKERSDFIQSMCDHEKEVEKSYSALAIDLRKI